MSDKTFGVKVSEELYEKVKSIIENSGVSSKDWFEKAVALTEVETLKTGSPDYRQDLSELEVHTTRIYQLVSNMILRANYLQDNAVRELSEKLESRETIISNLQSNAKELQERLAQLEEESKQRTGEYEDLAKQLDDHRAVNTNNQALIQEYKDKIDTLSSLVNEYKGYATENMELKQNFAAERESLVAEFQQKESRLTSSIEELKITVRDQAATIEQLKERLENGIVERNNQLENQTVNFENQLTQLTNQKELEKERAILEVERKYQEKLQAIHDQYNERLARLYEKFDQTESLQKKTKSNPK